MENTKTTCLFSGGRWIFAYFWPSNWHNFDYILGKVEKLHSLESPQKSLKTRQFHINRATHFKITALQRNEKCVFFVWIINIWEKVYHLENWGNWGVNYCSIYRPSKLLLPFIEYRLNQLNSKHTKTAVYSTLQHFESGYQKKKKCW